MLFALAMQVRAAADQPMQTASLEEMGIEQWAIDDGLGSNWVRDIAEDQRGFLWVATNAGLVRFDGRRFRSVAFAAGAGRRDMAISSLARGRDGTLWAGLDYGGVMRIVGDALVPLPPAQRIPDAAEVTDLAVGDAGTVWAATQRGLWGIDDAGARRVSLGGREDLVIAAISHHAGQLWVRTRIHGLWQRQGTDWIKVDEPDTACRGQTVSVGPRQVVTACASGIWRKQRDAGPWSRLPTAPGISLAFVDEEDQIWFGTSDGLARLGDGEMQLRPADRVLADPRLRAVHRDRHGDVWIGTFSDGLVRLRAGPVRMQGRRAGLSGAPTTAVLARDDGSLLVGAHHESLRLFVPNRGVVAEWRESQGLPGSTAWSLAADATRGGHWVGGDRGLAWLGPQGLRRASPDGIAWSGAVRRMHVDDGPRAAVWVADGDGRLHEIDAQGIKAHGPENGLRAEAIRFIHRRRDGHLVVGGRGGLFQQVGDAWTRISVDGLTLHGLSAVVESQDGTLWMASALDGLVRWAPDAPGPDARAMPLPFNPANSVWLDDVGDLWVSGNDGVVRLSQTDLAEGSAGGTPPDPLHLGHADGLRPTETNGWGGPSVTATADGSLVFASPVGLAIVDPRPLRGGASVPERVFVEEVRAGGVTPRHPEGLVLGAHERSLAIAFSAIEFSHPDALQFRYRLEGVDDGWVLAGRGEEASYARLAPGRHRFHLQARVGQGPWTDTRTLAFDVTPLWHERTDLRALGALVGLLILLAAFVRRLALLRRHRTQWRRARDFLRSVIDAHPHPIFVRQPDGRFLLANLAMAELLGRSTDALEGVSPSIEAFGTHSFEVFDTLHAAVLASGEAQRSPEVQLVDAKGWRRWYRVGLWPFATSPGEGVEHVIGIAEDITDTVIVHAGLEERERALRASREDARDLSRRLLAAQEEERRTLANELHDDYTQRLAGLALLAWGVHRRAPQDGGDGTRRDLEELAVELEEIARSIQHASRELHPPELQQTGLVESIRMACAAFSRRTGLSTLVHVHGTGREPEAAVGVAVYRIVQQALHNTLVHGCTDHATLDFSFGENSLALVIADEGRGFDVASPEFRPGLGLVSMRERARLAGITLVIESTLGRGMRLSLDIPLA